MADSITTTGGPPRSPRNGDRFRGEIRSLRHWFRDACTRENLIGAFTTLAWVVPLSVLIWVWAEREQLYRTENPIAIPIEVTTSDPKRVVTLVRPQEKMIMVDLEGARSNVEVAKGAFGRSGGPSALDIIVDPKLTPGQTHDLSWQYSVANNPVFLQNRVRVTNCQPPILTVYVDVFEEVELPVVPPATVTNLIAPPIFEPAKVKLRAPREAIRRAGGALSVEADLSNFAELKAPGVHELPAVRVQVPGLSGEHVTITPSTVKATLEVKQSDVSFTIPSVALFALMPSNLQKQYRVDCPDNITNVTVVGPPAQIELLKREDFTPKPRAALDVSRDDLPVGTVRTRTLRFYDLPEGVRVSAEDARRTVDFKLVERAPEP